MDLCIESSKYKSSHVKSLLWEVRLRLEKGVNSDYLLILWPLDLHNIIQIHNIVMWDWKYFVEYSTI